MSDTRKKTFDIVADAIDEGNVHVLLYRSNETFLARVEWGTYEVAAQGDFDRPVGDLSVRTRVTVDSQSSHWPDAIEYAVYTAQNRGCDSEALGRLVAEIKQELLDLAA